jgi:hypothetical protein
MKNLRIVSVSVFLLSVAPVFAGLNSAVIVLPSENIRSAPAVTLVQPADYLCAIITIRSTSRDPERQANAMRETLQRVTSIVEKSSRYQLHQGAVHLAGGYSSSFSFSKAGAGPASLQTSMRILCPLGGNADIFETMKQLRKFIAGFQPAEETDLQVASMTLAVAAPEQYRERLLALIADQSRSVQQTLGARSVAIDGLQNAVVVRQVDDANVEIFIDYLLSATVDTR